MFIGGTLYLMQKDATFFVSFVVSVETYLSCVILRVNHLPKLLVNSLREIHNVINTHPSRTP